MKCAILMRHAKSSWSSPGMDDHARPLNKRGRTAAPMMAAWLRAQGIAPDSVLGSTAERVRETIGLMADANPDLPSPEFRDALYHAGTVTLHQTLRGLPAACATVLLVAHEPGLSAYVEQMGGPEAPPECQRAYGHFPTAAMAILWADVADWAGWTSAATQFSQFVVPRELA